MIARSLQDAWVPYHAIMGSQVSEFAVGDKSALLYELMSSGCSGIMAFRVATSAKVATEAIMKAMNHEQV